MDLATARPSAVGRSMPYTDRLDQNSGRGTTCRGITTSLVVEIDNTAKNRSVPWGAGAEDIGSALVRPAPLHSALVLAEHHQQRTHHRTLPSPHNSSGVAKL